MLSGNKKRQKIMDREISQKDQSKNTFKKILPVVLIFGTIAVGYYFLKTTLQKTGKSADFHIVQVERGNIKQTLSAAGTVIAATERVINSPVSTEIESVLLSTGTDVKKGDLILKLDKEYTSLEYEKLQDELSLRRNNIDKLKLQFDKDLRDLDYQDQIKALQLSELRTQVADQKRLLDIGGATAEEVEGATLQLSIAEIEKKVIENELEYKRSVNTTDKKGLQLEIDIQVKRLRELKRKLGETQVTAPQAGVITWINEDIGKTVAEGEPLVKIANLNKFKIEATTSDRNSGQLQIGLPVEVRIGKDKIKGQISRILPEIINNTVKFYVSLEDEGNDKLRPNLRTEINIIAGESNDVLRAKRGTGLKGTSAQYLYKVVGNEAIKVSVRKGMTSSEYFEIKDGLNEGDKLIVSETKAYEHMDSFIIEE